MTGTRWLLLAGALLTLPGLSMACDRAENDAAPVETSAGDTGVVEGLSRDQISKQVQPLTPEEAERMGMVDTIVRPDTTGGSTLSPVIPGTPPPVSPGADTVPRRP